jgi:hypothetical protein
MDVVMRTREDDQEPTLGHAAAVVAVTVLATVAILAIALLATR